MATGLHFKPPPELQGMWAFAKSKPKPKTESKSGNEYNKSKKRKDLAYRDLYADDSIDSYYSEEEMNEIPYEEYEPPKAHKTKRKTKTKKKQIDHLPPININMQRYIEDT